APAPSRDSLRDASEITSARAHCTIAHSQVDDGRRFSERWLTASLAAVAVRVRPHRALHRNKRRHCFQWAALRPTADTNTPGRCCPQVDTESASCQAMDGAGHHDHALQAGGRGRVPLAPPPSAPMTSQVSDLTSRASPSPVSLGLILAIPACSLAWDLR